MNPRLYILYLFIIIQVACKKKDTQAPVINFQSPNVDQVFDVFTKIEIEGFVKDDHQVSNIRITLTDSRNATVGRQKHISPEGKEIIFKESLYLDDPLMESGYYHLIITATDGINEKKAFRRIYIKEIPRKRRGIFVVESNGASININLIDSAGNKSLYKTFTGDWAGTAVSSRFQELSIAGSKTGDFVIYDLADEGLEKARINSFLLSEPTFTGLDYEENNSYLSFYNGQIRGYGKNGIMSTNAAALDGFYSKMVMGLGEKFISFQGTYSSSQKRIAQYFRTTGAILNNLLIDFDAKNFCRKDKDHVVVFGNRGTNGVLGIYEVLRNNIWEPLPTNIPPIYNGERIDEKNYLLATSEGFYLYTYPSLLSIYKAGVMCRMSRYDELNNELILIENGDINIYNFTTKAFLKSYSFSGDILDIQLWYNK
jgi:hypothetical protein